MTELIIPQNKWDEVMSFIGERIVETAIKKAPSDLGELRRSIQYNIQGNVLTISCDVPYAEHLEWNKGPMPNVDENVIRDWVRRHNKYKENPAAVKRIMNQLTTKGIAVGTVEKPLHITSWGRNSYRPFLRVGVHQVLTNELGYIIQETLSK